MSMTSLQAQLAVLNGSSGKHPGSVYASSRRHEDALGRGLHFRPEKGHAVTETIRFKASFIYPTADEAAKVPLRILEDNGREAALHLSNMAEANLSDSLSLAFSTTDASPETLKSILIHISTLMGENNDAVVENCLHVLEYLLRRYKLNLTLYEDLVWCFLPHHGQRASLLHRCLQLGDLAANQSYLFLRPYSDSQNPVAVPRGLLAQHIIREGNLLRILCHMVREATAFVDDAIEREESTLRYGLGFFFSWAAACVVEGLAWQRKSSAITDTEREAMLRILVPTVRHCCMSTHDARAWGYIVASAAAETMTLGDSVLSLWTCAIMEYAGNDNTMEAWAALLSILVPPHTGTAVVDQDTYFPLLQGKWLGCPLPHETFDIILSTRSVNDVANILGELHQELQVTPLLAAFLVLAVRSENYDLVRALLHSQNLESLWKDPGIELLPSVSAWFLTLASKEEESKSQNTPVPSSHRIDMLKDFHHFDPNGAEHGFAFALQQTTGEKQRNCLIRFLKQVVSTGDRDAKVALPRVALDDPDPAVRIEAVYKLSNTSKNSKDERTTSSLVDRLLHRWAQEVNFGVAKVLAKAIANLLPSGESMPLNFGGVDQPKLMLSGFYRFIERNADDTFLQSCLQMMEASLRSIGCNAKEKQLLSEACVACFFHKNKTVVKAATRAFGEHMDDVAKAILQDRIFLEGVCEGLRDGTPERKASLSAELAIRERCAASVLTLFADFPLHISGNADNARFCVDLSCTLFESTSAGALSTETQSKISTCLELCVPVLVSVGATTPLIVSLASAAGDYYETVAAAILKIVFEKLVNEKGSPVPPVAVIMEASLQHGLRSLVVCRLIQLATNLTCEGKSPKDCLPGIIPALSLLENDNEKIRLGALSFLESIGKRFGNPSEGWASCDDFGGLKRVFAEVFCNLGAGSVSTNWDSLTTVLSRCVKGGMGEESRVPLLRLCNLTSRLVDTLEIALPCEATIIAVPSPQESFRSIEAAGTILKAMELSGEEAFPLLQRWNVIGLPLVEAIILQTKQDAVKGFVSLLGSVVKMLKGRYIMNAKVAFSTGPRTGGGRVRSYSLSQVDGARTLGVYPATMSDAIVRVLKSRTLGGLELASYVLKDLFLDSVWVKEVFPKLNANVRIQMFSASIELVDQDLSDAAATTFLQLPFEGSDIRGVLRSILTKPTTKLGPVFSIARFLSANAERLGRSAFGSELVDSVLETFSKLVSNFPNHEEPDFEYACQVILNSLDTLVSHAGLPDSPSSSAIACFPVLLALQTGGHAKSTSQSISKKYRIAALRLTATLANAYPESVLKTLRDGLIAALRAGILSTLGQKHRVDLLSAIVEIFWKNSDTEAVAFRDILFELTCLDENEKKFLLADIVASLKKSCLVKDPDTETSYPSIGSFAAIAVAKGDHEMASKIILLAPNKAKMPSLLLIFQYIKNLISALHKVNVSVADKVKNPLPTEDNLRSVFRKKLEPDSSTETLLPVLHALALLLRDCLQLRGVRDIVKKGAGEDAKYCLLLWQGSLWLHAEANSSGLDSTMWKDFVSVTEEIRDELQASIPMALFLASVSRLLEKDARSNMLSQALSLVAERASHVDPNSSEASLFLGILPEICEVIGTDVWSENRTTAAQAALLAAEHIGRAIFLSSGSKEHSKDSVVPLLRVFEKITDSLETGARKLNFEKSKFGDLNAAHRDLICSLALAASTMIYIVQVRALALLPRIIRPLVLALSLSNRGASLDGQEKRAVEPRDMQLATIRAITAVAETVPQSLGGHIQLLMVNTALLAPPLRSGSDVILRSAVIKLDEAISTGIPARLLLPMLTRVIETEQTLDVLQVIIPMLQICVGGISAREAGGLKGSLFACITKALDSDVASRSSSSVLEKTSAILVSFVLKLSEGQLRRVYVALKDWKNELKPDPDFSNQRRRAAFWAISAALADQLKSLFLPCVSLVINDVVAELEHGVALLCKAKVEKLKRGKKKRRLSEDRIPLYAGFVLSLRQVLLFLERFLRSDAREGGNWIRADERYTLILEPLTKLLHSDLSFKLEAEVVPPYEALVGGTSVDVGGNVVGCITALALAAGDEQLWKPLNHSVLEAAGADGRSEVRKAGLSCLLCLMKSLGEEYMVLLPECLPVLSELLEDPNEEVAGLARDVITEAEDLLGESLEETLR